MKFDGEKVEFDLYKAMKHPVDDHSLCSIDVIEPLAQDLFDISREDELQSIIENDIDESYTDFSISSNMQELAAQMDVEGKSPTLLGIGPNLLTPSEVLVPSVVQAPEIELKQRPSHLCTLDVEIKDKKGAENLVADHLSRLVNEEDKPESQKPILGTFPDDTLCRIEHKSTPESGAPTSTADAPAPESDAPASFPDAPTPLLLSPSQSVLGLHSVNPWYRDIVNYLVCGEFPPDHTKAQTEKIR